MAIIKVGDKATAPSIRPSLLLDFANTKALDPRITFTRASTATYWDGHTTAKAEENLQSRSTELNSTYWLPYNTTLTPNSTTAPDGTNTAAVFIESTSTNNHYLHAESGYVVTTATATAYTWSVYLKKGSGATAPDILCLGFRGATHTTAYANFNISTGAVTATSSATATISNAGNGWYRCTVSITANASGAGGGVLAFTNNNPTAGRFASYTGATTADVFVWGPQFEQRSSATAYTPTTSVPITKYQPVLQTAESGVPRFDHDPVTGESKGLLIEGARTNIVTHSHNIAGNSFNYLLNVTTVANTAIAPDGTQSADSITPTSTSAIHYCGISGGYSAGSGTETFSVFLKANGYDKASLILANQTGAYSAYFDLTAGTIDSTGAANLSQSIVDVGNGWYRCSFSYNTTKGNPYPTIGVFQSSSGYTSSAGDGFSGVLAWGAQIEAASYPTSYIPTVGSTVTRAAEQTSITGSSFDDIYNVSEGTVFTKFMFGYNSDVDQKYIVSGGSGYARWLYTNAGDTNTIVNYDGSSNGVVNTTADNVWSSAASRSSLITLKKGLAVNGSVSAEQNASGTINTLSTEFRIGHNSGAAYINGWMSKFAYYPKALPDAELQALTEE